MDSLMRNLKKAMVRRYGKDTASFGPYFGMMYHPQVYLETFYEKYLNILADYEHVFQKSITKTVLIPNITDSMPAIETYNIKSTKEKVTVEKIITVDSIEARRYIYTKMIKREGEGVREVLKERDMIYVPTKIISIASGTIAKDNLTVVKNIYYEKRINLGNPFDRINRISFHFSGN